MIIVHAVKSYFEGRLNYEPKIQVQSIIKSLNTFLSRMSQIIKFMELVTKE